MHTVLSSFKYSEQLVQVLTVRREKLMQGMKKKLSYVF